MAGYIERLNRHEETTVDDTDTLCERVNRFHSCNKSAGMAVNVP